MSETYGFVYLWFDRKHKRYYVGAHWGNETDGYVCSSAWMKRAYKNRPTDFKRKILKRIYTTRIELFEEEQRYLDKIKDDELKHRYYNLSKLARCPPGSKGLESREKQKATWEQKRLNGYISPNKGRKAGTSWNKGISMSEESKQKLRDANKKQFEDDSQREMRRQKSKELWDDPVYRENQMQKRKGLIPWNKGKKGKTKKDMIDYADNER